jgi:hypothetical protein
MFQNLVFTCLALNLESPLKESKMKYLVSILAFCLISICQSQNLILETTPKLIELKKNAVAANNYESAAKIKKEIDLRNKVDSITRATDLQIKVNGMMIRIDKAAKVVQIHQDHIEISF